MMSDHDTERKEVKTRPSLDTNASNTEELNYETQGSKTTKQVLQREDRHLQKKPKSLRGLKKCQLQASTNVVRKTCRNA